MNKLMQIIPKILCLKYTATLWSVNKVDSRTIAILENKPHFFHVFFCPIVRNPIEAILARGTPLIFLLQAMNGNLQRENSS